MHQGYQCMKSWQKKRKWMFINFCVAAVSYGLSLGAYFSTEYFYLTDTVKVKNPDLYFGLSKAALCLSGAIASIIGGYYVDYTKNIREICLLEDVLNIAGNILYSLHYSPYLIIFGQLLIGTTSARMTGSVGEVSRVYHANQLTQKIGILGIMTLIGSIVGPSTVFVFQYVDLSIGHWKWNIGNMIGISMTVVYLFQFVLNFITLNNVSKEYTIKNDHVLRASLETNYKKYDNETTQFKEHTFNKKYLTALKSVLQDKHILFWLIMSILVTYARNLVKLILPIKGKEYLNWKPPDIAKLYLIALAIGSIPTMILITILARYVNDFYLYLSSLIALLLSLSLMGLLPILKLRTHAKDATKMILYSSIVVKQISSGIFHVLSRSMLAKFVPENVQSITEGFRNILYELAALLSGLSVTIVVNYLSEVMLALTLIVCALTVLYVIQEGVYQYIKVTDVKHDKLVLKY